MRLRRLAVPLLATVALLAACGTGGATSSTSALAASGGEGTPAAACTPTDAPRCDAPRAVASAEAFLAEQRQLRWQQVASSRSGPLQVSVDLVAGADLVIDATTLSLPEKCTPTDAGVPRGCSGVFREDAYPSLNDTARVAGVSCAVAREPVRRGWGDLCSKLAIARGTVFRMRNVVLDNHPELELHSVELVPACSVPCATGEARCAGTQTCLPLGYATCAYCDGKSVAACACTDACNARAEGAKCGYDSSPDTPVSGTCTSGECRVMR